MTTFVWLNGWSYKAGTTVYNGLSEHYRSLKLSFCQRFFFITFFLALLDYVSRAHEIEIRPSSVVRRPSVRRPSVRPSVCGIDYL